MLLMGRIVIAVLLLLAVFGGKSLYQHLASTNMNAQEVANEVGRIYYDAHPRIVRVISDETEGSVHEPMYGLTVFGHFRNGNRTAQYLIFSALASRHYAWGLWAGNTLPSHTAHRSWFADVVPLAQGHA